MGAEGLNSRNTHNLLYILWFSPMLFRSQVERHLDSPLSILTADIQMLGSLHCVLVFCSCCTKLPQLQHLKMTKMYYFTVLQVRNTDWIFWFLGSRFQKAEINTSAGPALSWRLWEEFSSRLIKCWQNSVSCDYRTEGTPSLLAVSWELLFTRVVSLLSLPMSLHHRASSSMGNPSHSWNLSNFLLCSISSDFLLCCISQIPVKESFLLLRAHVIIMGPPG